MPLVQSNPNGYLHPDVKPPQRPLADALSWLGGRLKRPFTPEGRQGMADDIRGQFASNEGLLGAGLDASQPMKLPGIVGMFAGVGAKTANLVKKTQAEKLLAKGVIPEQVYADTGWFRGVDGKMRFEIPDDAAAAKDMGGYWSGRGDMALKHDKLYAAYPETAYMPTSHTQAIDGASFSPEDGVTIGKYPTAGAKKSATLHELQHAIQQREGFASGGNVENAPVLDMDAISAIRTAKNQLGIDPYKIQNKKASGFQLQQYEVDRYAQWEDLTRQEDALLGQRLQPYEAYRRLAGEAEARLTQKRMNMTAAERAASYPPRMFDVPVDEQIVRGLLR